MKKLKAALLSLLAFVVGAFCLVACGETNDSGSTDSGAGDSVNSASSAEIVYTGTYKFESMTMPDPTSSEEGATITITVGQEYMGMSLSANFMVIELKDGGIAVVSSEMMGASQTMNGTWTKAETEGQIVITVEDDPQTFTCDGTTMTADEEGMKITLKKSA